MGPRVMSDAKDHLYNLELSEAIAVGKTDTKLPYLPRSVPNLHKSYMPILYSMRANLPDAPLKKVACQAEKVMRP
eukprot:1143559-Pelagomonas_calceolata.AAC.4